MSFRRIIFGIFLTISLFSTNAFAQNLIEDQSVKDVISKWEKLGINFNDKNELLNNEETFNKDGKITRGEFSAYANKMFEYQKFSNKIFSMKDITSKHKYYNDLSKALTAGYMSGTSKTTVSPDLKVTREQAIASIVIISGLDIKNADLTVIQTILDSSEISNWAKPYVASAIKNKLIDISDGKVYPKQELTKIEALLLLDSAHVFLNPNPNKIPYDAWESDQFVAGDGTVLNPFQIASKKQLLTFSERVKKNKQSKEHFKLIADIDLLGEEWDPIGKDGFRGTFDGNGFLISNVKILKNKEAFAAALFSTLDGGTIKNLAVKNVEIKGQGLFGGIVAVNNGGTIDSCVVYGKVRLEGDIKDVGGIVGVNRTISNKVGTITDSYVIFSSESYLTAGTKSEKYAGAGGIAGVNFGQIENCYASGFPVGNSLNGAIVGIWSGGTIVNCYYNQEWLSSKIDDKNNTIQIETTISPDTKPTMFGIGRNEVYKDYHPKKEQTDDMLQTPEIHPLTTWEIKGEKPFSGFSTDKWRFIKNRYATLKVFTRLMDDYLK